MESEFVKINYPYLKNFHPDNLSFKISQKLEILQMPINQHLTKNSKIKKQYLGCERVRLALQKGFFRSAKGFVWECERVRLRMRKGLFDPKDG